MKLGREEIIKLTKKGLIYYKPGDEFLLLVLVYDSPDSVSKVASAWVRESVKES